MPDPTNIGTVYYRCMPRAVLSDGELSVEAVQPEHIETIRRWRNEQINVLRQTAAITREQQEAYYANHIWPTMALAQPKNILLAYKVNGRFLGYGGLVHIAWEHRRAEISFLIDTSIAGTAADSEYHFPRFLRLLKMLAFEDLDLERLCTETYAIRQQYIATLERSGFHLEGVLKNHIRIDGKPVDSLLHGCLRGICRRDAPECDRYLRNILVTSASMKAPLIRAAQAAARRIHPDANVFAGDQDDFAITRFVADEFWKMPTVPKARITTIINGCIKRQIRTVLPTRDAELLFWSQHQGHFKKEGIDVVISNAESIQICLDKLTFARFGLSNGLPFIPAGATPEAAGDGPYVVKEQYGAGAHRIGLRLERKAAMEHARLLENPIFQPFIAGTEISVDAWVDRSHKVKGVVLRTRDRVANGESQISTTFRDTEIETIVTHILELLELRGPIVLQALIDAERKLHIIECNTRFGGASTLAIEAGLDMLYWTFLESYGVDVGDYPFNRVGGEIKQVRVFSDVYVHDFGF